MKILTVAPYISSVYGGTSKIVTEITTAIGNCDVAIDLVTTNANGANKIDDVPLNSWITKNSYRIQYFDCWHKYDFVVSLALTNWLFNHVTEYDLIHTHTIFAPQILLTQWICKFHHIPYISTPHGMLEPWALSYKAWKKNIYYNLLEKLVLKKASAIQGTASTETNNLKNLGFDNTFLVPNGIHFQDYRSLSQPEIFYQKFPQTKNKNLILFLGRIDPKKGLDLLAPAFAKAYQNFPDTHLIVAGPDSIDFMPTAEQYFIDAGCRDAVTFTGMLKGELKLAALAAASLYVAPSYSEGFSMSILEGMASGLPCVITNGCNFPEAAAAKVAHVVDIDVESIADALLNCLGNPEQAQEMGLQARQFIWDNYTWNRSAQKLVDTYQYILGNAPQKALV